MLIETNVMLSVETTFAFIHLELNVIWSLVVYQHSHWENRLVLWCVWWIWFVSLLNSYLYHSFKHYLTWQFQALFDVTIQALFDVNIRLTFVAWYCIDFCRDDAFLAWKLSSSNWCVAAKACNFTKSNTPPWVFFTFFKLCKCYQIAQHMIFRKRDYYKFFIPSDAGCHYFLNARFFTWRRL